MISSSIGTSALLLTLYILFGIVSPGEAAPSCSETFKGRLNQIPVVLTSSEIKTLRDVHQRLNEIAREDINTNREYALPHIPGDSFVINGRRYSFGGILGAGNEGLVVHAKRDGENVAVKFFYELTDFESNVTELRELEASYSVVRRREIDQVNLAIVFDYIKGVGLRDLSSLQNEIGRDLWEKIETTANEIFGDNTVYVYNSVIEIETGRLFLVDPR